MSSQMFQVFQALLISQTSQPYPSVSTGHHPLVMVEVKSQTTSSRRKSSLQADGVKSIGRQSPT